VKGGANLQPSDFGTHRPPLFSARGEVFPLDDGAQSLDADRVELPARL
jgi:hypothetical protein